jgi:4-amino-4-deoxy-L-arabinose transferase-like glycosyltransferase
VTPERPPFAWREVGVVVALQAAFLLALASRYGPHRDELYFVSAGQRLDWGYPDQPSFTPFLARLATEIAAHHLVVLRLPSILAVVGIVLLAVQFARLLDAGRAGQVFTAVVVAASAVLMIGGHLLSTATFDTLAWTAVLVLVTQAVVDHRPRLWLVAGVVAGIGLNNKHAVVFLLFAILVACALDRELRPQLRTPWSWLAGLIAVVMWIPNLVWQAQHDWPVFALSADIRDEYGGIGGRIELIVQAAIIFSPIILIVWVIGLVQLLRNPAWRMARLPALVFLVVLVTFLVTGGKGYYLTGAIVPLVAAGCTWLARDRSPRRLVGYGAVLVLSAAVAWPALVPVLPASSYASSFYPDIDDNQPETIGWPKYAAQVRTLVADLPDGTVVFTGNYGEAGAFEWYGVGAPVYSGHNGWRNWGPPPDSASPVVVVYFQDPSDLFTGCRRAATLHNDIGIDNEEEGHGVWVCDGPIGGWANAWGRLSHYDA